MDGVGSFTARTTIVFVALLLLVSRINGTSASRNELSSVCCLTQYKDSCMASLNHANSAEPEKVFRFSLSVVMASLQKLTSFPSEYSNRHGGSMVREALKVCDTVMEHAVYTLRRAVSATKIKRGGILFTAERVDDLRTWLSTVITDHEACLDALEEANAGFVHEIRLLMKNSTEFTSNSLAIISKSAAPEIQQVLPASDSFPSWVSVADRRLLQSSQPTADVTVAKDGSGDVTTINAAVQRIPQKSSKRFVIHVKAGVYVENVQIGNSQWNVMIFGDGQRATIISGSLNFVDGTPTFSTATVGVTGQGFMARDIGFRNTAGAIKHQAVAFRTASDQSVYYRCLFDAFQDTLYTFSNRQFYRECTITGTIDYIFGNSAVVFQNCNILPRQPMAKQFNTITAQGKTDPNQNTGISIQRCTISALDAVTAATYLGRPWKDYSTTVFMQSNLGALVNSLGWAPWISGVTPPSTILYAEYQNTGAGANTANRVNWAGVKRSLTAAQAAGFNVANFIQGQNWLPATGVAFDST